ncbi:MAG TPA: TatD family hydrolase [Conexivisphaerales archaeon]|nr:TatD family hydrolase [Conexivisphaerales archaeon]
MTAPDDPQESSAPLVDAHSHVDTRVPGAWELTSPQVVTLVNSTGMDDLEASVSWVKRHGRTSFLFAGLHPTNPNGELPAFVGWVEGHVPLVSGIGEIGLDKRIDLGESRKLFRAQLELASGLGMPATVHTRGRVAEAFEDLSSYGLRVLLHWFQGSEGELREGLDRGYYFSYGPPILYSGKMRKLLRATEAARLLLETDSPVRYPSCFESRESSPSTVASVYFKAAELLEVEVGELEKLIAGNASSFLGKGVPPS